MKLLYIMDPLCGWCYGNSENMLRLEQELGDQIGIDVIPGGMLTGDHVRYQDIALIGAIRSADTRLRSITGVLMSHAYDSLLDDTTILLDSEPPCRAINSIKKIAPEKVLKFSSVLARARYVDGIDNTKLETFMLVCEKLDIDTELFLAHYHSEDMKEDTREMFAIAVEYTNSYPAIFLVSDDSSMIPIPMMGYQYTALKNEIMKYGSSELSVSPVNN